MAEGKYHYVFRIKDEPERLLRITKKQFYDLNSELETDLMVHNCSLMNNLAGDGISIEAEHLFGGACMVAHAGKPIEQECPKDSEVDGIFSRIAAWSLKTRIALLDYNEGNWCVAEDGGLRFVDVDLSYTCNLSEIKENAIVCKRIDVANIQAEEDVLLAFLAHEKASLRNWLEKNFKA